MSTLNVDKVDPSTGTALELGTSGDTVTVPSGVGLTLTDSTLLLPTTITSTTEVKTNKISPATGTAFALGDSGDTFTIPSGATITNSGTATGFGGGKILSTATRSTTTSTTFAAASYAASDVYATITPTAASSKILVIMNYRLHGYTGSGNAVGGSTRLYCDIDSAGYAAIYPTAGASSGALGAQRVGESAEREHSTFQNMCFLHSPSYTLTDVLTYKLYATAGYSTVYTGGSSREMQTILIEVGA